MFEKRIGYPPPGTNQPDWFWKKPTIWTWIADGAGFVVCLLVIVYGVWRLIEILT